MSIANMTTSQKGIDFIIAHEGVRYKMYRDVAGLPTIGIGHLIKNGEDWLMTATLTDAQVKDLLRQDLNGTEIGVKSNVHVNLNQNQFDALVSLLFNIGSGNFSNSSVKRSINNNGSREEIETNWKKWKFAGGNEIQFLNTIRANEIKMYFEEEYINVHLKKKTLMTGH